MHLCNVAIGTTYKVHVSILTLANTLTISSNTSPTFTLDSRRDKTYTPSAGPNFFYERPERIRDRVFDLITSSTTGHSAEYTTYWSTSIIWVSIDWSTYTGSSDQRRTTSTNARSSACVAYLQPSKFRSLYSIRKNLMAPS